MPTDELTQVMAKIPSIGPNAGMALIKVREGIQKALDDGVENEQTRNHLKAYKTALDVVIDYTAYHQDAVLNRLKILIEKGKEEG